MGPEADGIRPIPTMEGKATFMASSVKEKARACTMLMALPRCQLVYASAGRPGSKTYRSKE